MLDTICNIRLPYTANKKKTVIGSTQNEKEPIFNFLDGQLSSPFTQKLHPPLFPNFLGKLCQGHFIP